MSSILDGPVDWFNAVSAAKPTFCSAVYKCSKDYALKLHHNVLLLPSVYLLYQCKYDIITSLSIQFVFNI